MAEPAVAAELGSAAAVPEAPLRRGRRAPVRLDAGRAELEVLDALFKGFADPVRLRILSVLAAGELCVGDLVAILALPQSLVSRHLAYLRRTGLVRATRESRLQRYRLAEPSGAVHESLLACVRGCFPAVPTLDRDRAAATSRARTAEGSAARS